MSTICLDTKNLKFKAVHLYNYFPTKISLPSGFIRTILLFSNIVTLRPVLKWYSRSCCPIVWVASISLAISLVLLGLYMIEIFGFFADIIYWDILWVYIIVVNWIQVYLKWKTPPFTVGPLWWELSACSYSTDKFSLFGYKISRLNLICALLSIS